MSEPPPARAPDAAGTVEGTVERTVDPFRRRPPARWTWARISPIAAVALGGALGGVCRYAVGNALTYDDQGIPWPTLSVNVTGSFVLAFLLVLVLDLWPPRRYVRPFFCTGFLGAFTTFSALAVEVDQRVSDGSGPTALAYLATTLAAGFLAAGLGLVVGRGLVRRAQRHTAHDQELR